MALALDSGQGFLQVTGYLWESLRRVAKKPIPWPSASPTGWDSQAGASQGVLPYWEPVLGPLIPTMPEVPRSCLFHKTAANQQRKSCAAWGKPRKSTGIQQKTL